MTLSPAELLAKKVARPLRSSAVAGSSSASSSSSSGSSASNGGNTAGSSSSNSRTSEEDGSDTCPICSQLAYKKNRKTGDIWVECEACKAWYHWACATANPLDSLDTIDKWYCPVCVNDSGGKLKTTYKKAQRRSQRTTGTKLDYANLDAHLPADVSKWMKVIATRDIKSGYFREMRAEELTPDWYFGDKGMKEPFWIRSPEGLDMHMPDKSISIKQIAETVGPDRPLEVIDVASQSSLAHWTLGQWAQYYEDEDRDKVRNVISLEVSHTKLGQQIAAPKLVRSLDWVENIWPDDEKEPGTYPAVQKYCLMSVKECWTDWHVDFAGSSVFYHVIRGGKVFYFIRPTPDNLKAYETWSGSAEKQENEWLGDSVDCVYKIELQAGNTMIIPTGWIHAVYTPSDSLVFGGNFLHSLNIPTQLRIYEIELATKVPRKFRFPYFVRLLWMVADHYNKKLSLQSTTRADALPLELSDRILDGLRQLSSFLWEQSTRLPRDANVSAERRRIARENVPWHIVPDPASFVCEFRTNVFKAMRLPLDGKCYPGYVEESVSSTPTKDDKAGAATTTTRTGRAIVPTRKQSPVVSRKAKEVTPVPVPTTKIAAKRDEGEIVSRLVEPVSYPVSVERRVDPTDEARGEREAEVRKTQNTVTVVRKVRQDDGSTVLETRTVVTTVERVKWIGTVDEPDVAPAADDAVKEESMVPPDEKPVITESHQSESTAPEPAVPDSVPSDAIPAAVEDAPMTMPMTMPMPLMMDPDALLSSLSAVLPPLEAMTMPMSIDKQSLQNGASTAAAATSNGHNGAAVHGETGEGSLPLPTAAAVDFAHPLKRLSNGHVAEDGADGPKRPRLELDNDATKDALGVEGANGTAA